jgi:ferredoxin-NADP reductase
MKRTPIPRPRADEPALRTVTLKGRSPVAERTMEFRFDKPPTMTYKAGHTLEVTLLSPPETDGEGNTRTFSIASAPDDDDLAIVTRLRDSAFKRSLQKLPLGTEIQIEGPYGNFLLHHNLDRPAVLLAGGIGVTPFHSMVRQNALKRGLRRILLFYSNRRPEDAPFLAEFRDIAGTNPNFTFVPTMSQMERSGLPWTGRLGRIEMDLIREHLDGSASPVYYIAGPPRMVSDLHEMLTGAGISDDDIRTEEFTGY